VGWLPEMGVQTMRRFLITALVFAVIGFVAGNVFFYVVSPLFIDRVVSEGLPPALMADVAASGAFTGADNLHRGRGEAQLLVTPSGAQIVRFSDFEVTNGPDLKVWLVKAPDPKTSEDVRGSEWISLGPLKGNIGDQNYLVPDGVDAKDYGSVVVWCEQFGVLFAAAPMTPQV
jgi:Electron transfer DM13